MLNIYRSFDFGNNSWTEVAEINNPRFGPGKRWKFSSVTDGLNMYIFGGFRIWHGFSAQNSKANAWEDFSVYPRGGYLDDLWIFNRGRYPLIVPSSVFI